MKLRFMINSTSYDYLADVVTIAPVADATQGHLGDGTSYQSVRNVFFRIRIRAVWQQIAGPTTPPTELWRLLVSNDTGTLNPDLSQSTTLAVRADAQRPPETFYTTRKGSQQLGKELRLFTDKRFAPTDQTVIDLADFLDVLTI